MRGIYDRLVAGGRFSNRQILTGEQYWPNPLLSAREHSAYQVAFGSNPTDLYEWGGDDEGLLLSRGTAASGAVIPTAEIARRIAP